MPKKISVANLIMLAGGVVNPIVLRYRLKDPPVPGSLMSAFTSPVFVMMMSSAQTSMQPVELEEIKLNHDFRRNLLYSYATYYALHIQDFGTMKTLPVLREILS